MGEPLACALLAFSIKTEYTERDVTSFHIIPFEYKEDVFV